MKLTAETAATNARGEIMALGRQALQQRQSQAQNGSSHGSALFATFKCLFFFFNRPDHKATTAKTLSLSKL